MNTNHTMVGILGSLGLALGASGAPCPPESCCDQSQQSSRVIEIRPSLDAKQLLEVRPVITGEHLVELRPAVLDTVSLQLLPALAPQSAQPEAKARLRVATRNKDAGQSQRTVVIANDDDTISLRMEDGRIVSLERNGKSVPADRIRKEGNTVTIVDENGDKVHEFTLGEHAEAVAIAPRNVSGFSAAGGPGAVWVAESEPPKVMIGVQLGEPDGLLLGHFGLEPGSATLITGVYDGLPAGKAGLQPYDIIVAVNGEKPAGQTDVRESLRDLDEGDKVTLTVIHRGEKKDVKIELVKYDAEALEKSELKAIEKEVMAFALGGAGPDNVMVAPGLGSFRSLQGADPEKLREFAEEWRRQADTLAERYKGQLPPADLKWEQRLDAPREWGQPATPVPPSAPRAGNEERWQRLEERLERLEKMIERLAEQKAGSAPKR